MAGGEAVRDECRIRDGVMVVFVVGCERASHWSYAISVPVASCRHIASNSLEAPTRPGIAPSEWDPTGKHVSYRSGARDRLPYALQLHRRVLQAARQFRQ